MVKVIIKHGGGMKKSVAVTLVLSGSLLAGCDDSDFGDGSNTVVTNNTYSPGVGYYHSYYRSWYQYPHNYYEPGVGYYYGGRWSQTPDVNPVAPTAPPGGRFGSATGGGGGSHIARSGFGFHGGSGS